MDDSPIHLLSEQERACLRLVPLNNTAEIARATGLSPETVKTYIKRACDKLGVNRRADAARMLIAAESCPHEGGYNSRGTDEQAPAAPERPNREAGRWLALLPVRKQGAIGNDLNLVLRLVIWIPLVAIGIAIAFGMLAVGIRVLADLAHSL
ncbi:helix-turn-helix transcriptional regulator [uncultured Sphingomonas sp.]|uniref:helix-turn-helix domain-containing protein n=1 Tax=uncultured Sphingomonas sp. TaxID=158754 RepID=UPI00261EC1B3|nr:helix-turn-helix transcriptional regulator [uncultured Sphingomonas sp.]